MDETTPIEKPAALKPAPAAETQRGGWVFGLVLTLLIVAAAGFVVRKDMLTQTQTGFAEQQEKIHQLTQRVEALETQTASLAALPRPDTNAIDTMHTDLGNAQATIAQLNDRIATLEKKPVPVAAAAPQASTETKPAESPLAGFIKTGAPYQTELAAWVKAHPGSAARVKALQASATTGLPTDDMLRTQLTGIVNLLSAPAAPVADESLMGRINSHLGGLITIKKQTVNTTDLAVLQAIAPSAPFLALVQKVEQLPANEKPSFAPWLTAVRARDAALAELATLDSTP